MGVPVPVKVWVTGVNSAEMMIATEFGKIQAKTIARMVLGAEMVKDIASQNLSEHNYTGRAANAVQVELIERAAAPGFSLPFPTLVTARVGIPHNKVPQFFVGSTFEKGWKSGSGKQPPLAPIAAWVITRGIADTPRVARNIAFAIARKQASEGYSFGTDKWLTRAWEMVEPMVGAYLGTGFTWRKK